MWLVVLCAFANDPRVSTSRGAEGGVSVLYPRVIGASDDPAVQALAAAVQAHTEAVARTARPDAALDVRPAPQRTCPQAGCLGASIGAVLVHRGSTCAVAAWVAGPGKAPAQVIAWSPGVEAKPEPVPFREPVENALRVMDHQPCATIVAGLEARDAAVIEALRASGPPSTP